MNDPSINDPACYPISVITMSQALLTSEPKSSLSEPGLSFDNHHMFPKAKNHYPTSTMCPTRAKDAWDPYALYSYPSEIILNRQSAYSYILTVNLFSVDSLPSSTGFHHGEKRPVVYLSSSISSIRG